MQKDCHASKNVLFPILSDLQILEYFQWHLNKSKKACHLSAMLVVTAFSECNGKNGKKLFEL